MAEDTAKARHDRHKITRNNTTAINMTHMLPFGNIKLVSVLFLTLQPSLSQAVMRAMPDAAPSLPKDESALSPRLKELARQLAEALRQARFDPPSDK
ncbi:hypothetical protein [Paracoccus fontiphilus]|uniref:Uncharacterized protein n=1 Tax=Paracoccus fontiphilus TaxID=1815556 RepID=A0ABV7IFP9_9RHOB|nr:hypothetical protein [Paracoccus fontiphilus]